MRSGFPLRFPSSRSFGCEPGTSAVGYGSITNVSRRRSVLCPAGLRRENILLETRALLNLLVAANELIRMKDIVNLETRNINRTRSLFFQL